MNKSKGALLIIFGLFILVFVILGVVFFSYLVHETFHVFHMKGAEGICLALGAKMNDSVEKGYLALYSQYDLSKYDNIEEYNTLREQSEKIAFIIGDSLEVILGLVFGIIFTYIYLASKGKK